MKSKSSSFSQLDSLVGVIVIVIESRYIDPFQIIGNIVNIEKLNLEIIDKIIFIRKYINLDPINTWKATLISAIFWGKSSEKLLKADTFSASI